MSEESPTSLTTHRNDNAPRATGSPDDATPAREKRVRRRRKERRVRQFGFVPRPSIFQNKVFVVALAIVLLFVIIVVVIPRFEGGGNAPTSAVE